jgi:hypothetical protein
MLKFPNWFCNSVIMIIIILKFYSFKNSSVIVLVVSSIRVLRLKSDVYWVKLVSRKDGIFVMSRNPHRRCLHNCLHCIIWLENNRGNIRKIKFLGILRLHEKHFRVIGHYLSFCILFKKSTFRRLDTVSKISYFKIKVSTMNNVQNCYSYINVPSSQTYT